MAEGSGLRAIPADVAACLESLEAAAAAEGTVLRWECATGGFVEYWLEDGEVRRREAGQWHSVKQIFHSRAFSATPYTPLGEASSQSPNRV